MKYIGQRIPTSDSLLKVTGEAIFTDDLVFPNLLHGKILTSPYAHAHIRNIDTSKAEALPGVYAVVTFKDSPETFYCRNMRTIHDGNPATERIFDDTVRYVGDKVAAVAAETEEIASKALRLINVQYDQLPAVFDPEDALKKDAFPIYPGGNLVKDCMKSCGDVDQALKESEIVVEHITDTSMIHHGAIEPHICVAYWSRDDELSVWEPQRAVHRAQIMLGKIFNVPYSKVQVHGQLIGGSFGSKEGMIIQPVALLLSKKSGHYVKIRYSRQECITSTYTRHSVRCYSRLGMTKEGRINALDLTTHIRVGPYCGDSLTVFFASASKFFKLYSIDNMRIHGLPTYTNTPLGGAMRGYGDPNLFTAIELLIDKAAVIIGMDPSEFRLLNLVNPNDIDPFDGQNLGNARVKDCLNKGKALFNWNEERRNCETLEEDRFSYGVGMATSLHGNGVAPHFPDITVASIELHEDGSVLLRTGVSDHGAGTNTLYKQIVAEILDMPMDHIELVLPDTHMGLYDRGAGSSRNTWVGGSAVMKVAEELLKDMKLIAADMMDISPEEVQLKDERFSSMETGHSVSKIDVAEFAYYRQRRKLIKVITHNSAINAGSYGAHFAKVRIDKFSGEVKILSYLAVCDVGRALNPLLLEGQIEGSIAMGIGMALFEAIELDEEGRVKNGNFKKYKIPHIKDIPQLRIELIEKGEDGGPFGAKSIGEAAVVPVAVTIVNAVNHALRSELSSLPLTPIKILEAVKNMR